MKKYAPSPFVIWGTLVLLVEGYILYGSKAPGSFHDMLSWAGPLEGSIFFILAVLLTSAIGYVFIVGLLKYDNWRSN